MAKSLAIDLKDIRSVTEFQRNTKVHIGRLKKTKAPMVLTVNGSATVIVQDAEAYQRQMARLEKLEQELHFIAAVNEGLRDLEDGRVQPALPALKALGRKHGL